MSRHFSCSSRSRLSRLYRSGLAAIAALFLAGCANTTMQGPEPERNDLVGSGPYQIRAYQSAPVPDEYAAATIYYPLDADSSVGGVAIAPGYTEAQRHINWWGGRLASHGFAVIVIDTNSPDDRPQARADGLMAAIETLRNENDRAGGPLFQRLASDRMAVMGHSMGGGGALLAADQHSGELLASIPFTPWQPEGGFSETTVPTLIMAGEQDRIAPVAEHASVHFQSLPEGTPRVYMEVAGGDHFIANNRSGYLHPLLSRYAVAWLKLYVDGDERYEPFIYGEIAEQDTTRFSRYITEAAE